MKMLTKDDAAVVLGKDNDAEETDEMDGALGEAFDALKTGTKEEFIAAMKNCMGCME